MAAIKKEPEKPATPATPDPAATPTPTFVPADEFKQFQSTINTQFQQFQENFNVILASLNKAPVAAPVAEGIEDVPLPELEQALSEGKGAEKFVKAINAAVKRLEGSFGKRVQELESTGLTAISELSKDAAKGDMPYYPRFKKEIDAYVSALPAHLRTNKQIYVVAHNAIVGSPENLAQILKEEREKILREAADPNAANLPTDINGRGKGKDGDAIPTVEGLLGKEAADALTSIGRSPDQHAMRMGHKDWATFATFVKEQEAANA